MNPGFRIITSQKLRLAAFAVFASLWIVGAVPATSPCPSTCTLPDCQCASKEIPGGLRRDQVPQMVTISFDDAIRVQDYEMFYSKILQGRRNRNGCDLPLTFFVSHKDTDYSLATELVNDGHELAVHSVTHRSPTTFWSDDRNNTEELTHEILDMRDILSRWAHVPKSNVVGYRTPFLASSENQLKILHENDFLYDCTMVTNEMYWPFTLDYKSPICSSPAVCPEESLPGLWVIPNINKVQNSSFRCSMIDSCVHPQKTTREHWMHFFMRNFERHYNNSKAPFGLYAHASWFYYPDSAQRLQAFMDFLDYLSSLEDVYIVTMSQLIAWSRNPTPLDQLSTFEPWQCPDIFPTTCTHTDQNICKYTADGEEYFIRLCKDDSCPEMYPNITNPLGLTNIVVSTPTPESGTGSTSTSSVNSVTVSSSPGVSFSPPSDGVSSDATGTPSSATVTVHSTFTSVTSTSSEIDSTSTAKPPSATIQSTSTSFTSTSSAVSFTSTGTSSSTTVDSTSTSGSVASTPTAIDSTSTRLSTSSSMTVDSTSTSESVTATSTAIDSTSTAASSSMTVDSTSTSKSVTATSTAIDSTSTSTSSSMTVDSTSTSESVTATSTAIASTSTGTSSSMTVDSTSTSESVTATSTAIDSTSTGTSSSMAVHSTSTSGSDTSTSTPSQVTTTDPINMDTTSIQSSETESHTVLETASMSTFESDSASAYKSATLLLSPSSTLLTATNVNTISVASTSSPGPSVTVNTETDTNSADTGDSSGSLEAGAAAGLAIGIVLLVAILVSAVIVAVVIGYVKWKRAHADPSVYISSNPGPFYYNPRAHLTM